MIKNDSKVFKIFLLIFSLLSLGQFLLYYVPFLYFYDSNVLYFITKYTVNFIEELFPVLAAVTVFLCGCDFSKMLKLAALSVLPRLIYTIPYYYVFFVSDVYNSSESLVLCLILSVIILIGLFAKTAIMTFIIKKCAKKDSDTAICRASVTEFNNGVNFGILMSVLIGFIIALIRETADTISFFIEYGQSYTAEEMISIIVSFIFIFISSFACYFIAALTKNLMIGKNS